jgi:hypothetical protein
MRYPKSTGEAAGLLGTTELRLADFVRRGKIQPPPPMSAGRRQWYGCHILQAAKVLGVLTPELEERLAEHTEVAQ